MKTLPVLGTPLAITAYSALGAFLLERADQPGPFAVDFSNTHIVTMRRHDPAFRRMTESMDLFVPDGMPLIWVLNRMGASLKDRVYGPTFTRQFLRQAPPASTHYLVGGSPHCAEAFQSRMRELNPGLKFLGGFHGLCDSHGALDRDHEVAEEIKRLSPGFIWVGLGTPKQYAWIERIKPQLGSGILLAVGFAFDVNAGTKPDAPLWMQKNGLTWLYRMASEPRRLVSRYAKWNSLFLWYLLRESLAKNGRLA